MGTKAMDKSGSVGAGKAAGAAEGWPTSNEGKSGKGRKREKGKKHEKAVVAFHFHWIAFGIRLYLAICI